MAQPLAKIAIAAIGDPRSPSTWSGTPAHLVSTLENHGIDVIQGGPLTAQEPVYYRFLRSIFWRLGYGWFMAEVEPAILRQRSWAIQKIVRENPVDAVVSIQADPISAFCTSLPTVLLHDCTFASLIGYYSEFMGLSQHSLRMGHRAYRQALKNASLAIFSSQWAARSARQDYGAHPGKIHVIEFGANWQHPPSRSEVLQFVASRISVTPYRFLFLGVDWERKGGADAIKLVRQLRRMGVPVHLDIVGCPQPVLGDAAEFCTAHGFLRKQDPGDRQKLEQLIAAAAFLVVPSRAECFGCIYCEANAFGVPSIGRNTGGVAQIIKPNRNGFLLADDGRNFLEVAASVKACLFTPDQYRRLAMSSRAEFEQRLNWDRFVEKLLTLIEDQRQTSSESPSQERHDFSYLHTI